MFSSYNVEFHIAPAISMAVQGSLTGTFLEWWCWFNSYIALGLPEQTGFYVLFLGLGNFVFGNICHWVWRSSGIPVAAENICLNVNG